MTENSDVQSAVDVKDAAARVVGRAEIEEALAWARSRFGSEVLERFESLDPQALLNEPLGITDVCLSINEVAAFLESDGERGLSATRLSEVRHHLAECDLCQDNLHLYESLKARNEGLRDPQHAGDVGPEISVHLYEPEGPIDCDADEIEFLLTASGGLPGTSTDIDPESLKLEGHLLESRDYTLSRLSTDPWILADVAYSVRFRPDFNRRQLRRTAMPICDWVRLEGRTTAGEPFFARSLLCLQAGPDQTRGSLRRGPS